MATPTHTEGVSEVCHKRRLGPFGAEDMKQQAAAHARGAPRDRTGRRLAAGHCKNADLVPTLNGPGSTGLGTPRRRRQLSQTGAPAGRILDIRWEELPVRIGIAAI